MQQYSHALEIRINGTGERRVDDLNHVTVPVKIYILVKHIWHIISQTHRGTNTHSHTYIHIKVHHLSWIASSPSHPSFIRTPPPLPSPGFIEAVVVLVTHSSTALLIHWKCHFQHSVETLALRLKQVFLLLLSSWPSSPSAGDCWDEAIAGAQADHPETLTCGRTPRTRTACCGAPCRRTSGWRCGSSSYGTQVSSAGWRPSHKGYICKDGPLHGGGRQSRAVQPSLIVRFCV